MSTDNQELEQNQVLDPLDVRNYTGKSLQDLRAAAKKYMEGKEQRKGNIMDGINPIRYDSPEPWQMDYNHAKKSFWMYLSSITKKTPHLHRSNSTHMANLIKWWIGDPSGSFDLNKGIYVSGDYGRGKTFIIKALIAWAILMRKSGVTNIRDHHAVHDYKEIIRYIRQHNSKTLPVFFTGTPIFLDDIGYEEDNTVVVYGDRINLVAEMIYHRHKEYMRGRTTLFTSNLTPEMLEDQAGQGSNSRLHEMCNIIIWGGDKDLRQL